MPPGHLRSWRGRAGCCSPPLRVTRKGGTLGWVPRVFATEWPPAEPSPIPGHHPVPGDRPVTTRLTGCECSRKSYLDLCPPTLCPCMGRCSASGGRQ